MSGGFRDRCVAPAKGGDPVASAERPWISAFASMTISGMQASSTFATLDGATIV